MCIRDRCCFVWFESVSINLMLFHFAAFFCFVQIVGDKFLREFGGHPERGWRERGEKNVAEFWGKNRCAALLRYRTPMTYSCTLARNIRTVWNLK